MALYFKKQFLGLLDLIRFKKLVPNRRERLKNGSADPIPVTYRVNEAVKILHPGAREAELVEIREETPDIKTFVFDTGKPFWFKAGQYATLGKAVDGSEVSRPYAMASSPAEAQKGRLAFTVKKAGSRYNWLYL